MFFDRITELQNFLYLFFSKSGNSVRVKCSLTELQNYRIYSVRVNRFLQNYKICFFCKFCNSVNTTFRLLLWSVFPELSLHLHRASEINEQSCPYACRSQVTHQLSFMPWMEVFHRFQFYDQAVIDN